MRKRQCVSLLIRLRSPRTMTLPTLFAIDERDLQNRFPRNALALAHTAARLNAELPAEQVLVAICEETKRALNVAAACIFLFDEKTGLLEIAQVKGLPERFVTQFVPIPRARFDASLRRWGPVMVMLDVQAVPNLVNA